MTVSPTIPARSSDPGRRVDRLEQVRSRYEYRPPEENELHPIAQAKYYLWWRERYDLAWMLPFLPGFLGAAARWAGHRTRFAFQRATFRFDKMRAYRQTLAHDEPPFVDLADADDAFGHWRVAGANALSLAQERDIVLLRNRIPLDVSRIERRLRARLGRYVSLRSEAAGGRLFAVDFQLLQRSLRPRAERDSRWRAKYLPAPVGVFLEAPDFYASGALVPLAIQIDQKAANAEYNPVYYPNDGWNWRIAKAFFEVADLNYHVGCGHIYRSHLAMEPFGIATPRQLSSEHPVYVLLQPHLRYTLRVNRAAYKFFTKRRHTYFDFYAGTLEETRQIAVGSHAANRFDDQGLESDLVNRGVESAPADYPFRDDARLWLAPIRNFVSEYICAFYESNAQVVDDPELAQWAEELTDKERGAVCGLVPGDRFDTREKLIALLTQVIFTAGPGHASQHYSSNYFYRYAPAFPGSAYRPPLWQPDRAHEARFENMLPPIETATRQVRFNTFTNYRFDRFGDYRRYPLGRVTEAQEPIRRLQSALVEVEATIRERCCTRFIPYEFLLPSLVPNSVNM